MRLLSAAADCVSHFTFPHSYRLSDAPVAVDRDSRLADRRGCRARGAVGLRQRARRMRDRAGARGRLAPRWSRATSEPDARDAGASAVHLHAREPGELAEALARATIQPKTYVLFLKPDGFSDEWAVSDLWRIAAAIPDVTVVRDDDGRRGAPLRRVDIGSDASVRQQRRPALCRRHHGRPRASGRQRRTTGHRRSAEPRNARQHEDQCLRLFTVLRPVSERTRGTPHAFTPHRRSQPRIR